MAKQHPEAARFFDALSRLIEQHQRGMAPYEILGIMDLVAYNVRRRLEAGSQPQVSEGQRSQIQEEYERILKERRGKMT